MQNCKTVAVRRTTHFKTVIGKSIYLLFTQHSQQINRLYIQNNNNIIRLLVLNVLIFSHDFDVKLYC